MKNILKLTLAAAFAAVLATSAFAQGRGVDLFGVPRSISLAPPTLLDATVATVTNGPIDTHGFDGIAVVLISSFTNAGGALTATFETSPDTNTWTALTYAKAENLTLTYTNLMYGTNAVISQTYMMPGTWTKPTAGTAGWATPYIVSAPFTNTGALTVTAKGWYMIGYNVADAYRYLHVIWTPTGTSSNDTVSALFDGYRASEVK